MKKTLLAVLLLVGLVSANVANANAWEWNWNLNDIFGDPYSYALAGDYGNESHRILVLNGITKLPELTEPGTGLAIDGNTKLYVDHINPSKVDGLDGYISSFTGSIATLTSGLSGKANSSHTHGTSDISGLGAFVDGRIATGTPMVFATSTRAVNTAFQVSTTKAAFVSYTVDIGAALSLLAGETGTVTLQYADDSAFTTNVVTVQSSANGNTGSLTIGLNLTQTTTASLTGMIPKGKYVRIATANTAGTPSFTWRGQQEVLLPIN